MLAPCTCQAKVVQDFTALPSTWTTQAPHCEVSQPTCVPVSRRCSRRNCTSRVRGSTSPVTGLPFTVIATAVIEVPPKIRAGRPVLHAAGGTRQQIGAKSRGFCPVLRFRTSSTLNRTCVDRQGNWSRYSRARLDAYPCCTALAKLA